MNKVKLYVSYTFILLTIVVYIVSSSYIYQLEIHQADLEQNVETLKEENDELTVEINMKNSRDSVMQDYPGLKFNNNIHFLEEEDNE